MGRVQPVDRRSSGLTSCDAQQPKGASHQAKARMRERDPEKDDDPFHPAFLAKDRDAQEHATGDPSPPAQHQPCHSRLRRPRYTGGIEDSPFARFSKACQSSIECNHTAGEA